MREIMEIAIKPFFKETEESEKKALKKITFYLGDVIDLAFYK